MKRKTLTFTILSNDAGKVVMRFQIPRISIPITISAIIVPIILLFYFIHTSHSQQQENAELEKHLHIKTANENDLQERVDHLEENEAHVQAEMKALHVSLTPKLNKK